MQQHVKHEQQMNLLIRKCHKCGQIIESYKEEDKCLKCGKAFMPLNYFDKIHNHNEDFSQLFSPVDEIDEASLIKGLFVIW